MRELVSLVEAWRRRKPRSIDLRLIQSLPELQPRGVLMVPFGDRGALEAASEAHIADMTRRLDGGGQLEPLLIAEVAGQLLLVDGHHRLAAYRRQGRQQLPACISAMSRNAALLASKLVNCDGAKLPMHAEQKRDAAWQYLASVTDGGSRQLPKGTSLRAVSRAFGITVDTASRMHRRLSSVAPADFSPEACDPGTGWPRWRWAKGNSFRDALDTLPVEARQRWQDERRAAVIGKLISRDGLAAYLRSVYLLEIEALDAAADCLAAATTGAASEDF